MTSEQIAIRHTPQIHLTIPTAIQTTRLHPSQHIAPSNLTYMQPEYKTLTPCIREDTKGEKNEQKAIPHNAKKTDPHDHQGVDPGTPARTHCVAVDSGGALLDVHTTEAKPFPCSTTRHSLYILCCVVLRLHRCKRCLLRPRLLSNRTTRKWLRPVIHLPTRGNCTFPHIARRQLHIGQCRVLQLFLLHLQASIQILLAIRIPVPYSRVLYELPDIRLHRLGNCSDAHQIQHSRDAIFATFIPDVTFRLFGHHTRRTDPLVNVDQPLAPEHKNNYRRDTTHY